MLFVCLAFALTSMAVSVNQNGQTAKYEVVPLPREIVMQKGEGFVLNQQVVIVADDGRLKRNAEFLREYLREETQMGVRPFFRLQ